ncbi:P-loop NTPase fold protein, partial [Prevotella sp.]|uniref:P-loop NTPase fold protein n=1 Tax=Prevotella sp. TaxID=59823 RepID=UPI00264A0DB8
NFISKHYNSAISLIQKYSKSISFANELGEQAEIEKEITSLLKFWIKKKKRRLKFVGHHRIKYILKLLIHLIKMYISITLPNKKNRYCDKKVILYIDDIDRCSETKMTSIIDSLRTVLENEEIRKRLIIICSIDPEKIIKGLEYKYIKLYNKDEIHSIAIDQMDKIFLTGIALSPLDNDQLLEFASKLTKVNENSLYRQKLQTIDGQDIITSDGLLLMVDKSTSSPLRINDYIKFDNIQIYKQLEKLIKDNKKQLTPRKIRIIYYRILLANNIIYKNGSSIIAETLIQNIYDLSVGEKINNNETSKALSDVLNMVVPYKYENEVKEDKESEVAS